ncbi:hypothetical protein J6590_009037 [Homalodisca vitripennis]|nr:hypothetical protein J6590_009037 [Homalodisca vitripennis]
MYGGAAALAMRRFLDILSLSETVYTHPTCRRLYGTAAVHCDSRLPSDTFVHRKKEIGYPTNKQETIRFCDPTISVKIVRLGDLRTRSVRLRHVTSAYDCVRKSRVGRAPAQCQLFSPPSAIRIL